MKNIFISPPKRYFIIIVSTALTANIANAEATFQIWPIYPKIESREKATAIWLKNTGKDEAFVQIRVLKWQQIDGKNNYTEQTEIIPSPPIVIIKPDEKTMLRLSRPQLTPSGQENAYRIIIDELPIKPNDETQTLEKPKISFQMRYSIPLFAYGKGIGSGLDKVSFKENSKNPYAKPILTWSLSQNQQNKPLLVIKNNGQKYARIGNIKDKKDGEFLQNNDGKPVTGYILASSVVQIEIDPNIANQISKATTIYGIDTSGNIPETIEITRD